MRDSLEAAGLVVNEEKSCWAPSQEVVWLGFIWNMGTGCICIPEEKLENLKGILQEVEKAPCIRSKQLASITGKIISMGLAVGPVARLRTRNMYCLLNTRQSWQDLLQIEENVKDEFTFWVTCVDKINGQKLWRSPAAVYSDASSTGYGGYLVEHGNYVAHGQWNEQEKGESSTLRELAAVDRVQRAVSGLLKRGRIKWFTDNQNVVRIIMVGSRVDELQVLALIFSVVVHGISIEPEWVPREENQLADYLWIMMIGALTR